jgi:hypothetical protein
MKMKKWVILLFCLSIGLLLPVSALADNHGSGSSSSSTSTTSSSTDDDDLVAGTFNVTNGFEQEVDLEELTAFQWTFLKGEATALYTIELPGKQLPATGWKDFYRSLGWDIAKTNATEITFSDGSKAILYSKVIGNSGKVRFWMDGEVEIESQELEAETEVMEKGIQLRFAITSYYIIWINGQEFARIHDNQVVIDKFLIKGANRITIERTNDQFVSLDARAIYRLFFEWSQEASTDQSTIQLIQVIVPTENGKTLGSNVDLSFQWIAEEPMPEGVWYIWVDQSTQAVQTDQSTFTLNDLEPGTHLVKIEYRTQDGKVISVTESTFVVPTKSGGILPETASPWPNLMVFGLVLMMAGAFIWFRWGRRVS